MLPREAPRRHDATMSNPTRPLLPIDPQRVDETGLPWAFLSNATDLSAHVPGLFVVVGPASGIHAIS